MNWISEKIAIASEKNGEMWKYILAVLLRYTGVQKIKRILILGLSTGGAFQVLARKYPKAEFFVLEQDAARAAMSKRLRLHARRPVPTIIYEDPRVGIKKLNGTYDIILADVFGGQAASPLVADSIFLKSLHQLLSRDGYLIANVYNRLDCIDSVSAFFTLLKTVRVGLRNFGLFQRSEISGALRSGFRSLRQWPDLNTFESIPKFFNPSRIGVHPAGNYWTLWPFSFEQYEGDDEPSIEPLSKSKRKPVRIIMWQRTSRFDIPKHWTAFSERPAYKTGFIPLTENYFTSWSETGKRDRKKFMAECVHRYVIESVSYEVFSQAYKKSTLPMTLKDSMLYEIRFRSANPKTSMTFLVARRISDSKVVAGIAYLSSGSVSSSYYQGGFFLKEVRHEPIMTGLFDRWFQDARARGVRYIDLGNFWKGGDDDTWKGFSVFKAKYGPFYFFLPPTLYQFRFGNRR